MPQNPDAIIKFLMEKFSIARRNFSVGIEVHQIRAYKRTPCRGYGGGPTAAGEAFQTFQKINRKFTILGKSFLFLIIVNENFAIFQKSLKICSNFFERILEKVIICIC